MTDNKIEAVISQEKTKLKIAMIISKVILVVLFIGTFLATAFFMVLGAALWHGFQFEDIPMLFKAFPQFFTPLFILVMYIFSTVYEYAGFYKKALISSIIGIAGTIASVVSIWIMVNYR